MKDIPRKTSGYERARYQSTASKKRKRKRNYTLYYILLLLFVMIAGITLSVTVFFNIETIKVVGNEKYNASEIIKLSAINKGDNLFRINLKDSQKRIQTALIYTDKVVVRRKLPSTLEIKVQEAKPSLCLKAEDSYALISEGLRLLEIGIDKQQEGIPQIAGLSIVGKVPGDFISDINKEQLELYTMLTNSMKEYGLDKITSVDITKKADIKLVYDNRVKIDLGSSNELNYKIKFVKEIVTNKVTEVETGTIDAKQPGKVYFNPGPMDEEDTQQQPVTEPTQEPQTQQPVQQTPQQQSQSSGAPLQD